MQRKKRGERSHNGSVGKTLNRGGRLVTSVLIIIAFKKAERWETGGEATGARSESV